jgi:hypothetical protein
MKEAYKRAESVIVFFKSQTLRYFVWIFIFKLYLIFKITTLIQQTGSALLRKNNK